MTQTEQPDLTKYVEQDPEADYVFIAEYIRRRHALDLTKDPLAAPLHANTVNRQIKCGSIEVFNNGSTNFIDWNKYKNFVFKRYFQGATLRKQAK